MMKTDASATDLVGEFDRLIDEERFDEAQDLLESMVEKVPPAQQTAPFTAPVRIKKQLVRQVADEGIGTDLANTLSRRLRNAKYRFKLSTGYSGIRILEEGDSWSQFPVVLHDITDNLIDRYAVYSLGAAGDTLEDISILGEFVDAIRREKPHLFFLSGGGNDVLGEGRFAALLHQNSAGADPEDLIRKDVLERSIGKVIGHFESIITRSLAVDPKLNICVHGYDRALPRKTGKWLGKPLQDKEIGLDAGAQIVAYIIDAFNEALGRLAARFGNNVHYADLRGLVLKNGGKWFDEIHPDDNGFRNVSQPILDRVRALREQGFPEVERLMEAVIDDPDAWKSSFDGLDPALRFRLGSRQDLVRHVIDSSIKGVEAERVRLRHEIANDSSVRAAWMALAELKRELEEPEDNQILKNRKAYRRIWQNFERIIGEDDLDDFFVLKRGLQAGKAVARLLVAGGLRGTGFLVGPGLLLTNNHVIPNREMAEKTIASFNYELGDDGLPSNPVHFRVTGDVFLTSEALDYSFVSVAETSRDGQSLSEFGYNPLFRETGKTSKREYVNLLQHPGGNFKKVALRENLVLGYKDDHVYYVADTMPGSSGGCVCNTEWLVVALHHMAIPSPDDPSNFVANRGVRISAILADVEFHRQGGQSDAIAVDARIAQGRIPPSLEEIISESAPDGGGGTERQSVLDLFDRNKAAPAGLAFEAAGTAPSGLSEEGYQLIVDHETGGRSYYENVIRQRPVWPRGESGVTIGCGYDLGYHDVGEFEADWKSRLSSSDYTRLKATLGKTGHAAQTATETVRDIRIPWRDAIEVFDATTLPKYVDRTYANLPANALDALHPHCVSALVSLVFNRGASFRKAGDRYREMRAILSHLQNGRPERIPAEYRSMKRLWQNTGQAGLLRRRDEEADLFQKGLDLGGLEEGLVNHPGRTGGGDPDLMYRDARDEAEFETALEEDLDREGEIVAAPVGPNLLEAAPQVSVTSARWPNSSANAPDTWHLPPETADDMFELTPQVLRDVIKVGHFNPSFGNHGKLIVSLRGCQTVTGESRIEDRPSIVLRPALPDHENFRCLLGVWDTQSDLISLYLGSTVPRRTGMLRYYNFKNFGGPARMCNMLPTGLYGHAVGRHISSGSGLATTFVLRLGDGPSPADASRATVLRTRNDLIYGTMDDWDDTKPHDNIHPAFLSESFSSLGCLTVRGMQTPGGSHTTATGEWRAFRRKAGFDGTGEGTRFDNLLVTGHEAASVAAAGSGGGLSDLSCLRHGSQGEAVRRLQEQLGIGIDGSFGAGTKKVLAERQIQKLGMATGTWTPNMAGLMGLDF